jgi:hypothetical protein
MRTILRAALLAFALTSAPAMAGDIPNFNVTFPCPTGQPDTEPGGKTTLSCNTDKSGFMVVFDAVADGQTDDELFDNNIESVRSATNGALRSQGPVAAGGLTGREAFIDVPAAGMTVRLRMFVRHKLLAVLTYIGPTNSEKSKDADDFFDGFKFGN